MHREQKIRREKGWIGIIFYRGSEKLLWKADIWGHIWMKWESKTKESLWIEYFRKGNSFGVGIPLVFQGCVQLISVEDTECARKEKQERGSEREQRFW